MGIKIIAQNRKARHDYHILDTFEVGIVLQGTEVKTLRGGQMSLQESFVDIEAREMYLVGAHIPPYEQGNRNNHDPNRKRKLLMQRHQIDRLGSQIAEKGLTIVPLKVYFTGGLVKLEIGLARGKNTIDKRQTIKEREAKVDMQRAMKER